jgi:glycosyltransferase involved in cell wall biosynthesis
MQSHDPAYIGYVVKRYPRYSETFVVNEILAQEAAGARIDIFSLRAPEDAHFQDTLSRVRAPVTYLPDRAQKATDLWEILQSSAAVCPDIWDGLQAAVGTDARELAHALALAAEVRERGITHLHAHFASSATTVARLAARFAGVTFSFTAHAKDLYHESVDPQDLHDKLRDAVAVITVSEFNVRYLARTWPLWSGKVHRIYNGLDLERFRFCPPGGRDPLIVSVGRLVEKKGFRYLIEACQILKERGTRFRCVIVGGGEDEAALRSQIDRLGLASQVSMEGPRPQREVMELVQSSAVFAAPCVIGTDGNRDGLPTVLLEAMALGTPCVATDVTGIPEVIHDGETGLLVRQEDPWSLANAVEVLLADIDLQTRLARRARALIEAEFDVHRNTASLSALITDQTTQAFGRVTA